MYGAKSPSMNVLDIQCWGGKNKNNFFLTISFFIYFFTTSFKTFQPSIHTGLNNQCIEVVLISRLFIYIQYRRIIIYVQHEEVHNLIPYQNEQDECELFHDRFPYT